MISDRAREVLTLMRDAEEREEYEDAEIVCQGLECWVGFERISRATVNQLLRLVLIRGEDFGKGIEHFTINEDGRAILTDPNYKPKILAFL